MTSTFPDISISTERLVLRPFDEDDVPALTEMMNDEQVAAWTDVPAALHRGATPRDWITRIAPAERTEGRGIVFAVTEFLTQRLVGIVQLAQHQLARPRPPSVATSSPPGRAARATPPRPRSPPPSGSSATRSSSASNCARPPTTPPRSRSPRRSAASVRACCATPA